MRKVILGTLSIATWVLAFDASARFVSTDPVTADQKTGANFNRYNYANNNPYRFTDPDGRIAYQVNNTIYIPVTFTGSGATPELINSVVKAGSNLSTADGTRIAIVPVDRVMGGVNVMNVSPHDRNPNTTYGEGIIKQTGNIIRDSGAHIDSRRSDVVGAVLHDTMHFAHLPDRYTESPSSTFGNRGPATPIPGFEDSIMGSTSGTMLHQSETAQFGNAFNGLHDQKDWEKLQQRIDDGK